MLSKKKNRRRRGKRKGSNTSQPPPEPTETPTVSGISSFNVSISSLPEIGDMGQEPIPTETEEENVIHTDLTQTISEENKSQSETKSSVETVEPVEVFESPQALVQEQPMDLSPKRPKSETKLRSVKEMSSSPRKRQRHPSICELGEELTDTSSTSQIREIINVDPKHHLSSEAGNLQFKPKLSPKRRQKSVPINKPEKNAEDEQITQLENPASTNQSSRASPKIIITSSPRRRKRSISSSSELLDALEEQMSSMNIHSGQRASRSRSSSESPQLTPSFSWCICQTSEQDGSTNRPSRESPKRSPYLSPTKRRKVSPVANSSGETFMEENKSSGLIVKLTAMPTSAAENFRVLPRKTKSDATLNKSDQLEFDDEMLESPILLRLFSSPSTSSTIPGLFSNNRRGGFRRRVIEIIHTNRARSLSLPPIGSSNSNRSSNYLFYPNISREAISRAFIEIGNARAQTLLACLQTSSRSQSMRGAVSTQPSPVSPTASPRRTIPRTPRMLRECRKQGETAVIGCPNCPWNILPSTTFQPILANPRTSSSSERETISPNRPTNQLKSMDQKKIIGCPNCPWNLPRPDPISANIDANPSVVSEAGYLKSQRNQSQISPRTSPRSTPGTSSGTGACLNNQRNQPQSSPRVIPESSPTTRSSTNSESSDESIDFNIMLGTGTPYRVYQKQLTQRTSPDSASSMRFTNPTSSVLVTLPATTSSGADTIKVLETLGLTPLTVTPISSPQSSPSAGPSENTASAVENRGAALTSSGVRRVFCNLSRNEAEFCQRALQQSSPSTSTFQTNDSAVVVSCCNPRAHKEFRKLCNNKPPVKPKYRKRTSLQCSPSTSSPLSEINAGASTSSGNQRNRRAFHTSEVAPSSPTTDNVVFKQPNLISPRKSQKTSPQSSPNLPTVAVNRGEKISSGSGIEYPRIDFNIDYLRKRIFDELSKDDVKNVTIGDSDPNLPPSNLSVSSTSQRGEETTFEHLQDHQYSSSRITDEDLVTFNSNREDCTLAIVIEEQFLRKRASAVGGSDTVSVSEDREQGEDLASSIVNFGASTSSETGTIYKRTSPRRSPRTGSSKNPALTATNLRASRSSETATVYRRTSPRKSPRTSPSTNLASTASKVRASTSSASGTAYPRTSPRTSSSTNSALPALDIRASASSAGSETGTVCRRTSPQKSSKTSPSTNLASTASKVRASTSSATETAYPQTSPRTSSSTNSALPALDIRASASSAGSETGTVCRRTSPRKSPRTSPSTNLASAASKVRASTSSASNDTDTVYQRTSPRRSPRTSPSTNSVLTASKVLASANSANSGTGTVYRRTSPRRSPRTSPSTNSAVTATNVRASTRSGVFQKCRLQARMQETESEVFDKIEERSDAVEEMESDVICILAMLKKQKREQEIDESEVSNPISAKEKSALVCFDEKLKLGAVENEEVGQKNEGQLTTAVSVSVTEEGGSNIQPPTNNEGMTAVTVDSEIEERCGSSNEEDLKNE